MNQRKILYDFPKVYYLQYNSQNKAWNPTFRDIWILNQVISKEIQVLQKVYDTSPCLKLTFMSKFHQIEYLIMDGYHKNYQDNM